MEANDPQFATAPEDTATYVVQVPITGGAWEDVYVTLSKRSKTRTVLMAGLKQAGVDPVQAMRDGLRFRVLNEKEAATHGLKEREPREPELELA
jgi:hypothetical protein